MFHISIEKLIFIVILFIKNTGLFVYKLKLLSKLLNYYKKYE